MSNSNVNSELSAESKTSFITVTSMMASMDICSDPDKEKEEINLNSLNKNFTNINTDLNQNIPSKKKSLDPLSLKNESLMSISMSQEEENFVNLNLKKNNSSSSDKFQDLPLQYSKRSRDVIPHLIVEDKGEKRDYLGTYKNYEISKINEKNEKSILCYRRYDNFDIFYNKLKKKYPYHLIPKLIGKNALSKIMTIDSEFYNKRRRQLNYFLNYLYNHSLLKDSREFLKFMNDPDFDEEYFKKEDNLFYFPEASKSSETISKKIYGVFSGLSSYFNTKEDNVPPSEGETLIKKMEVYYKKMLENFKEIKNHMITYINNIKKSSENYSELANNFFYLKDVSFENLNTKDSFLKYNSLCNDLVSVNKNHFLDKAENIEDKFEGFVSILSGLCETFDRYTEFLKSYAMVYRAQAEARSHSQSSHKNYDSSRLSQEWKSIRDLKTHFEKGILDEVKLFVDKYSKEYCEILENYKLLIKSINTNEVVVMKKYSIPGISNSSSFSNNKI